MRTFNIACVCVLAGGIKHLSNSILGRHPGCLCSALLSGLPRSTRGCFLAVSIEGSLHPQRILTKSVTEICKATLRELGESAPFISLQEDGNFLFYSCLSFSLLCFAGFCERYSCLHWLKWAACRQTMKGISAVCCSHGQSRSAGLLSLFGIRLSQSMMNGFLRLLWPAAEGLRLLW